MQNREDSQCEWYMIVGVQHKFKQRNALAIWTFLVIKCPKFKKFHLVYTTYLLISCCSYIQYDSIQKNGSASQAVVEFWVSSFLCSYLRIVSIWAAHVAHMYHSFWTEKMKLCNSEKYTMCKDRLESKFCNLISSDHIFSLV